MRATLSGGELKKGPAFKRLYELHTAESKKKPH